MYSGFACNLFSISSKVKSPCVAPNADTTPAEFTDAYIKAWPISNFVLPSAAQNVDAKASPAPNVDTTGPSKTGQ